MSTQRPRRAGQGAGDDSNERGPRRRGRTLGEPRLEVIHAAVPGRLRVRIAQLRGDTALARAVVQRLGRIQSVNEVVSNPRTGSVLLWFDTATSLDVLSSELQRALRGLFASWQAAAEPPAFLSELPLGEASLSEVVAVIGRVLEGVFPSLRPSPEKAGVALRQRRSALDLARAHGEVGGADLDPRVIALQESTRLWHSLQLSELLAELRAAPTGLSEGEATRRRFEYGPNALPEPERRSRLAMIASQFQSVPVALLGASAVLSVATGGLGDAVAIVAVVLVNAAIGYATESNADRIISSLGHTAPQSVDVLRNGSRQRVSPESLVVGDVVLIAAGSFVAADARLLEANDLVVDESALTGESMPVHKNAEGVAEGRIPLADRFNMVFRGTLVTGGSGIAVVVAIGTATQIGQVQSLVSSVEQRETPLQTQLGQLGLQLALGAGGVCAAMFVIGLLHGHPTLQILETAVSLAVAAIPEGLPTVAITTLSLGIRHLAARKVLVRQLTAVETLGAIQVLCMDKTGTITVNRMTAGAVFVGQRELELAEMRAHPGELVAAARSAELDALLRVAVLCSEVQLALRDGVNVLSGSPTESALVQLALDCGLDMSVLRAEFPLLATQYRSESRSYMATLHRSDSGRALPECPDAQGDEAWLAVKGRSPEVLALCSHQLRDGAVCALTPEDRGAIQTASERMAGRALRVLGFASARRPAGVVSGNGFELESARDLVWLGLVGMSDPPRPGMRDVLRRLHAAGVRTVMITGDQSATAYAIGKAVGLSQSDQLDILDANELEGIAPDVLRALAQRIHIFSRVSPTHKLQIVRALQSAGYTVAMTGDGVNDGPALRAADVGVAMGGSGSSAAREVADVILENDDLETMIGAIEQGRAIYDDIKKAVHFILSTNISEILLTFLGVASGVGATLTPMQLLWINLLTDIFPELALAVQPPEADVLTRPPRRPDQPMFDSRDLTRVALEGSILTLAPVLSYGYARGRYSTGPKAGTLAFTVLAISQLLHVVSSRSEHHTIFDRERLATNRYIPMALGGGVGLQLLTTLTPGLRRLLGVVPLSPTDWAIAGVNALGSLLTNETIKLVLRSPNERTSGGKER